MHINNLNIKGRQSENQMSPPPPCSVSPLVLIDGHGGKQHDMSHLTNAM